MLTPPKALEQLAQISDFRLFVTTTFDTLLENTLQRIRYKGQPGLCSLAYARYDGEGVKDLKDSQDCEDSPTTVYYLLGKLTEKYARGQFVICDDDLLELVCDLQKDNKRPQKLFNQLQDPEHFLLLLGADFPDWLARFFLRTARQQPLRNELYQLLADSHTLKDGSLVFFLDHLTNGTSIYTGGAAEFVDQLWQRWRKENANDTPTPQHHTMPRGSIFISYASEDLSDAQQLYKGLYDAGLGDRDMAEVVRRKSLERAAA